MRSMEMKVGGSALEDFQFGLKGEAYVPGDEGYDGAGAAWNLNAHQHPAVVVVAEGAANVLAAVRLARDEAAPTTSTSWTSTGRRRSGAGRLLPRRLGTPGRAQGPPRPEQPLPLQPQHPAIFDVREDAHGR